METYILKQNVLTDNLLYLAIEGRVFKGGYLAIIEEYSFKNSWSDEKKLVRFRSVKSLDTYLSRYYPNFSY